MNASAGIDIGRVAGGGSTIGIDTIESMMSGRGAGVGVGTCGGIEIGVTEDGCLFCKGRFDITADNDSRFTDSNGKQDTFCLIYK
jgi:hypothetical protein